MITANEPIAATVESSFTDRINDSRWHWVCKVAAFVHSRLPLNPTGTKSAFQRVRRSPNVITTGAR
jgi:hypothetical protein